MKNAFITGNSSGFGLGLTETLLDNTTQVFGCSRRGCPIKHNNLHDQIIDLCDFSQLEKSIHHLLQPIDSLDLVILNAGTLGKIDYMHNTAIEDIKQVMDINVWANKAILDALISWDKPIQQIILMSSGASVLGNKGWNAYALSKASLNMLSKLYAHELPNTQINAVAPGLIATEMTNYLCEEADDNEFPALKRIREASSDFMLTPKEAAQRLLAQTDALKGTPSGDFIDIRQLIAPEEYNELIETAQANRV